MLLCVAVRTYCLCSCSRHSENTPGCFRVEPTSQVQAPPAGIELIFRVVPQHIIACWDRKPRPLRPDAMLHKLSLWFCSPVQAYKSYPSMQIAVRMVNALEHRPSEMSDLRCKTSVCRIKTRQTRKCSSSLSYQQQPPPVGGLQLWHAREPLGCHRKWIWHRSLQ